MPGSTKRFVSQRFQLALLAPRHRLSFDLLVSLCTMKLLNQHRGLENDKGTILSKLLSTQSKALNKAKCSQLYLRLPPLQPFKLISKQVLTDNTAQYRSVREVASQVYSKFLAISKRFCNHNDFRTSAGDLCRSLCLGDAQGLDISTNITHSLPITHPLPKYLTCAKSSAELTHACGPQCGAGCMQSSTQSFCFQSAVHMWLALCRASILPFPSAERSSISPSSIA